MMDWILAAAHWLVDTVAHWGYGGIFFLMLLESTLVPIPSELIVPPAGYLVSKQEMHLGLVILAGTAGSIAGALVNYGLAIWLGRPFLYRFGKYFFCPPATLDKNEQFFGTHGEISTFTGRLILGVRHFISLPAGLARMHLGRFVFYTGIGSCIWVTILAILGWLVGRNEALLLEYLHAATLALIGFCVFLIGGYVFWYRRRNRGSVRRAL